jgi:hypothetical protein
MKTKFEKAISVYFKIIGVFYFIFILVATLLDGTFRYYEVNYVGLLLVGFFFYNAFQIGKNKKNMRPIFIGTTSIFFFYSYLFSTSTIFWLNKIAAHFNSQSFDIMNQTPTAIAINLSWTIFTGIPLIIGILGSVRKNLR